MDKTPIPLEKTIEAIGADRAAICAMREPTYSSLPRPGYALPMAWRCGVEFSNEIVDAVPRYSSADHGSLFKSLLTVVCNIRSTANERFSGPHFYAVLAKDEVVESCLELEHSQLACLNLEVSLREGYWRASYHSAEDAFRLSLAPPQRRSALALTNIKAEFLSYPREVREILSGDSDETSPMRAVSLTLATGLDEVVFLRDAVPGDWSRLTERIGFDIDEAVQFQAFVQALSSMGKLWFRFEELAEWYADFAKDKEIEMVVEGRFRQLVAFFSVPPETLAEWGIAVPFVRFNDWFALWPFVHHVLPPSLTFLSLLMRKHPTDWNNTVGSDLAEVASFIRAKLPDVPELLFATKRRKSGVGDIDLGIYDPESRVLLLCEVKTVFDRYRTNYQLSNFIGQRVNFGKAAEQLAKAKRAIETGVWTISDIFGGGVERRPPKRILSLVLSWYDQYNPWLGDDGENPESCNFRVFQHLFTQAEGDLVNLYDAIAQLSRVYCVAFLRPQGYPVLDEGVAVTREVQTDALPPEDMLSAMPLSKVARQEIEDLERFPRNWIEEVRASGGSPVDYRFYEYDEG